MRWPATWERDPISDDQVYVLLDLLGGSVSNEELEGFLIVCSRLVDEFGSHRTHELAGIFQTSSPEGRDVLRQSLRYMNRWVGGWAGYETNYPVVSFPARPAFPLFKIVGVERIVPTLFRVLDSRARLKSTREALKDFVARTGRLPGVPRQGRPVRRSKPRLHWCAYNAWATPMATRDALQILEQWKSDCSLRASIPAAHVSRSTFLVFNGDTDPKKKRPLKGPRKKRLEFLKYFYEPSAQDHSALPGGGLQVGVAGAPRVSLLEEWYEREQAWRVTYHA